VASIKPLVENIFLLSGLSHLFEHLIKPLVENIFLLSGLSHLFEHLIKPLVETVYKKMLLQTFREI